MYLRDKVLEDKSRYFILYGGAGSGKSVFVGQKILLRLLKEKNHRFLVARKVGRTLRNSVFSLFKDLISQWGLNNLFTINKTEMTITCINGNSIMFVGLDDVEKLKSIAGVTGIWIEEASEINKTDFDQLDLRLRGKTANYKQIIITFNPTSDQSWLKKEFFDRKVENSRILRTTYLDNKFIDDEYKKTLERLKETHYEWYRIYALGEWGSTGQKIFTNWEVKEIPIDPEEYTVPIYSGIDFGFNDPSAFIRIAVRDGVIYVFDELYETELTNAELIEKVEKKMEKKRDILICDAAEPDRIKEFKKTGFLKAKPAKKGAGSILSGIDKIKHYKVLVHPRCENVIMELQNYEYMKDKQTEEYLDQPKDNFNHLMDAFRYAMECVEKTRKIKAGLSLY